MADEKTSFDVVASIAPESTYGTEATTARQGIEINADLPGKTQPLLESPKFGSRMKTVNDYIMGNISVDGDMQMSIRHAATSLHTLFMNTFGRVSNGTSGDTYVHAYFWTNDAPSSPSFSAFLQNGLTNGTLVYKGCIPKSLKLDLAQNGLMNATFGVLARDMTNEATNITNNVITGELVAGCQQIELQLDGATVGFLSGNLTFNNNLIGTDRRDITATNHRLIKQPLKGACELTGELTIESQNMNFYNYINTGSNMSMQLVITGDATLATSSHNSITLYASAVVLTGNPKPQEEANGITRNVVQFTTKLKTTTADYYKFTVIDGLNL